MYERTVAGHVQPEGAHLLRIPLLLDFLSPKGLPRIDKTSALHLADMSGSIKSEVVQEVSTSPHAVIKTKGSVDTIHNDEAVKILSSYAGDGSWTEDEEKKLRRKVDCELPSYYFWTHRRGNRRLTLFVSN